MASDIRTIMKLEVPVVVQLGTRALSVSEVVSLLPGAIIELPKRAEAELELMVNNKVVGTGKAVKVGENFGIRISFIGDAKARVAALRGSEVTSPADAPATAGSIASSVGADAATKAA